MAKHKNTNVIREISVAVIHIDFFSIIRDGWTWSLLNKEPPVSNYLSVLSARVPEYPSALRVPSEYPKVLQESSNCSKEL